MTILIVARIDVRPEIREKLLKDAAPLIQGALDEPGCKEYAWSMDSRLPGRINVLEEWESEESLRGHFESEPYRAMRDHISSLGLENAWSQKYRIALAEPVYDDKGTPRADFVTA